VPVVAIRRDLIKKWTASFAHPGVWLEDLLRATRVAIGAGQQHDVLAMAQAALRFFFDSQKRPYGFSVQPFLADLRCRSRVCDIRAFSIGERRITPVVFLLAIWDIRPTPNGRSDADTLANGAMRSRVSCAHPPKGGRAISPILHRGNALIKRDIRK